MQKAKPENPFRNLVDIRNIEDKEFLRYTMSLYEKLVTILVNPNKLQYRVKIMNIIKKNFDRLYDLQQIMAHNIPQIKATKPSEFRLYGKNGKQIQEWEDSLPIGFHQLVTRPDGVCGSFIKPNYHSDNWFTLARSNNELSPNTPQHIQLITAIELLRSIMSIHTSNRKLDDKEADFNLLTQHQLQEHLQWIKDTITLFR